ncbi:hypothetical protein M5689_003225 [Euphorbia peplus]|nr:hypothetical protein M5689_003225 [Euphorbia peplus]
MTPFEAVYGIPPPLHIPYFLGDSKIESVDQLLKDRETALEVMKHQLRRAQNRMKQQADGSRSERSFEIREWVYVKLRPYRQQSVIYRGNQKLSPLYFGPFQVEDRIGLVAYRLKLPSSATIHPVFHVSQLKKKLASNVASSTTLPTAMKEALVPMAILDRKMVKRGTWLLLNYWSIGQTGHRRKQPGNLLLI